MTKIELDNLIGLNDTVIKSMQLIKENKQVQKKNYNFVHN